MDRKETEQLKQKLELLGEPALPARLTAEELFRRMDSGELALPEEESAATEQPKGPEAKVIPWAGTMKRVLPVAACLALVLLLYRGQQTVFAPKGSMAPSLNSSSAAQAAPEMAQDAAAAEENAPAAYSYEAESIAEDAEEPDPTLDAASPRMAPEPAPKEDAAQDDNGSSGEDTGAADRARSREDEQKQVTNSGTTADAADTAPADGEEPVEDAADTAPTDGEEDLNPDIGWAPEDELPPIFTFQELEPYMLAAAAENAPGSGLDPVITWKSWNNRQKDKFVYTVQYRDETGQDAGSFTFYCHLDPEADTPEVMVDSFREGSIY